MNPRTDIAVIFDMDGVLVDSARPHWQSWRLLATEIGHGISEEQFSTTFGRQNRDVIPLLFGDTPEPELDRLADRKESIYRELIRDNPPLMPGAVELVQQLHHHEVKLAVGSSGPRQNIELILSAMGQTDLFDVLVCSDDITRGKPHPDVFLQAARRLQLPPARCVVIEDAPAGIAAAKAAGCPCIAVATSHSRAALQEADLIAPALANIQVSDVLSLIGRYTQSSCPDNPSPLQGEGHG